MAKAGSSLSLPAWMVLILTICLLGMAAHFFIESMGSNGLFTDGLQIAGHYDDTFILISLPVSCLVGLLVKFTPAQTPAQRAFGVPILLPPPNC